MSKKIVNFKENIKGITFGIRFNKSFKIGDHLGAIVDDLVYNEKSPFNGFFQNSNHRTMEVILQNENGSYLSVNQNDIIFNYIFDGNDNFAKGIKKIHKFLNYIVEIFKKYNIKNIQRIGIVYNHLLKEKGSSLLKGTVEEITNNNIDNPNTLFVKFSKKLKTTDGNIKKGIEDYKNVIYIMEQLDDKFIFDLDFQKYFIPVMENITSISFDYFIKESSEYLINVYYNNLPIKE